jgi:hypothetical protein
MVGAHKKENAAIHHYHRDSLSSTPVLMNQAIGEIVKFLSSLVLRKLMDASDGRLVALVQFDERVVVLFEHLDLCDRCCMYIKKYKISKEIRRHTPLSTIHYITIHYLQVNLKIKN